jgi:hypothetical protein
MENSNESEYNETETQIIKFNPSKLKLVQIVF